MPPTADDRPDAVPPDRADNTATIVVSGLVVDAYIGVLDFEHGVRQRVRFDVDVDTAPGYLDTVEATGEYVSYADIVEHIQSRASSNEHVELVETWADDIATFVLDHPLAAAVRVRVSKLDIFDAADGVGIVLERRRPNR